MTNLFDIVSPNFFSVLNGEGKFMYANILYLLFDYAKKNETYTLNKNDFVNVIQDYLVNHDFVLNNYEELSLKTNRDKATYIYRRLKDCSWIDEEISTNQEIMVNFEDYAIAFLETYANFNVNNSFELSSFVYSIYQQIINFNIEQGYLTLHTIISDAKDLISKLRSLNSNIKKYIKRVISLDKMNEEELLSKIFNQLLGEYKEKVIDKAYYYMKTNDNPVKYQTKFLSKLGMMQNDNNQKGMLIFQIMMQDEISYEDAQEKLMDMFDEIANIFDTVIEIMHEIDKKNSKYISIAVEKIKIIMNHDTNIEGYLLHILKNYYLLQENDLSFSLIDQKLINNASLYATRTYKNMERCIIANEECIESPETKEMLAKVLKYSKNNILKLMNEKLNEKDTLTINDFDITKKDEFIKLLLSFVYDEDEKSNYEIIKKSSYQEYQGLLMNDFEIKRRMKDE